SRVSFPLSAADLPPSPTKSSNLSETAEVPACNVPSRSPLPALAIAPETKLGTASSGLGTLEPRMADLIPASRSQERFSRNAETDIVCRLLLEKKKKPNVYRTFRCLLVAYGRNGRAGAL